MLDKRGPQDILRCRKCVTKQLEYVPDCFKTKGMCKKAVRREPYTLPYIPDHLITQEICEEVMCTMPVVFFLISDRFKMLVLCIKALEMDPWHLYDVPYHLKTQKMCDDAVWWDSYSLQFVSDWFVTRTNRCMV